MEGNIIDTVCVCFLKLVGFCILCLHFIYNYQMGGFKEISVLQWIFLLLFGY